MKDVWGCEGKTQMATPTMVDEENGMVTKYWSCPVKFIPSSVLEFLQCVAFYSKHPSAPFPAIDEISPRYMLAERLYEYNLLNFALGGK